MEDFIMGKENVAMGTKALSTGDKILRLMKDSRIGISDLADFSGIYEGVILEILAGVCEADIDTLCRIADALGVGVHELRPDRRGRPCYDSGLNGRFIIAPQSQRGSYAKSVPLRCQQARRGCQSHHHRESEQSD